MFYEIAFNSILFSSFRHENNETKKKKKNKKNARKNEYNSLFPYATKCWHRRFILLFHSPISVYCFASIAFPLILFFWFSFSFLFPKRKFYYIFDVFRIVNAHQFCNNTTRAAFFPFSQFCMFLLFLYASL